MHKMGQCHTGLICWICGSGDVSKYPLQSAIPTQAQPSSDVPNAMEEKSEKSAQLQDESTATETAHKAETPQIPQTPLARAILSVGGAEQWKQLGASARRAALAAVLAEVKATPEVIPEERTNSEGASELQPEHDQGGHASEAMSTSPAPRFNWEVLVLDPAERTRLCESLVNLGYVVLSAPLQLQPALGCVYELIGPFFDRPAEEKNTELGEFRYSKRKVVGYRQRDDGSQFLEVHAAAGGNIHPNVSIAGFAPVAAVLHRELLIVGRQVMAWMSDHLAIPTEALVQCLDEPALSNVAVDDFGSSVLRLCNYAQCSEPVVFGEHTDASYLTLAPRSSTPGLQTWDRAAASWLDIEKDLGRNDIVVFIGDFVEVLTKGKFQATLHRVVLKPEDATHRLSMPFLIRGQPEAIIDTVPFLEENPKASLLRVDKLEYDGLRKFLDLKGRARTRKRGNQCGNDRVLAPSSLGGSASDV